MSALERIRKSVSVFFGREENQFRNYTDFGPTYASRPDRTRLRYADGQTMLTSIYTRMAIDVSSIDIRHVDLDEQARYKNDRVSGLNDCLTLEANVDQAARDFKQDLAMTLFKEGVAVIVATNTNVEQRLNDSFDIHSMRIGTVVEWMPRHVKVSVYDDRPTVGRRVELVLPKNKVAIIQNPLYDVMNEPNSTLKRLTRKLSLLDKVDEASSSGKLDLIIQLPYVVKNEAKKKQAEERANDIELQLRKNQYGIAYTDGTEKITQLNRPAENNLLKQIEYLTQQLFSELGMTPEVFNGKADEATMLNYHTRTIEPIITSIIQNLKRTFLTKTARTQGQSIEYFRDPFKLVPISQFADIADRLARNEVVSSNELRGFIGLKPSTDPKADQLVNSNMPQPGIESPATTVDGEIVEDEEDTSDESALNELDAYVDEIFKEVENELNSP